MKIVQRPDGCVTAYFDHTCGHSVPMLYGAREFAEYEQAAQEARPCFDCWNRQIFADLKEFDSKQ